MDGHEPQDAVAPACPPRARRTRPSRLAAPLVAVALLLGAAHALGSPAPAEAVVDQAATTADIGAAAGGRREQWGTGVPEPTDPYGTVRTLGTPYADRIVLSGWVADPSTLAGIRVDVAVDGVVTGGGTASQPLGAGSYGFDLTVPAAAGATTACAIGRNVGAGIDVQLGCRDLRPPPGGNYSFMGTEPRGHPYRFDPCAAIRIAYNPLGGPSWGRAELDAAVAELRSRTGLSISVLEVNEPVALGRPLVDVLRYGASWSPILVGYSNPTLVSGLTGGVAGLGGPSTAWGPDGRVSVTGIVILDGPQVAGLPTGWGTGPTLAKLIAHELGHVIGLGHATDTTQLMAPIIPSRAGGFAAGDVAGLGYLGSAQPCRRLPVAPVSGTVAAATVEGEGDVAAAGSTGADAAAVAEADLAAAQVAEDWTEVAEAAGDVTGAAAPDGLPPLVQHVEAG